MTHQLSVKLPRAGLAETAPPTRDGRLRSTQCLYCLFFVSGIPALLYQIVWQRALFTIYGVNIGSVTIVVSAFMLGLGLGSLAGGAASKIAGLPVLAAFGTAELCIGAFGICSLRLIHWVGLHTAGSSPFATSLLAFLLVLAPTILMGGTLPFLVAFLVRQSKNVGGSIGILYFVNTLGSAIACQAASEVLMRSLGEQGSVTLAAAINFAIGAAAVAAHFLLSAPSESNVPKPMTERAPYFALLPFPLAMGIAATSGFVALSYEILWYRLYSFVSGSRAQVFALLLAAYLYGVAVGSLFSRLASVRQATAENRARHLRLIAWLSIVASCSSFLVGPVLGFLCGSISFLATLPLVAISAALMGSIFPIVSHMSVAPDESSGARVSYLYLSNIIGSTLGTILVGFVLMDHLTTRGISLCLIVIGVAMGAAIASSASGGWKRLAVFAAAASLVLGAVAAAPFLFDRLYERLLLKDEYTAGSNFAHLLESRSGVVAVTQDATVFGGGAYDGRFNTSLIHDSNLLARAFAVTAFHPHPCHVLMIGLSSGSWAQVIANHPDVEDLTIVEINPSYLRLMPQYSIVASLLRDPKVHIVIDDGRRWLVRYPERRFDLVVMNTTIHWRDHASNLLSTDFLRIMRPHLEPGGVLYYNTTSSPEVQLTGATVFPYALRVMNFLAVSDQPLHFDTQAFRDALLAWRIDGRPVLDPSRDEDRLKLEELLGWPGTPAIEYGPAILRRTQGARVITDDNMGTEWSN
jgi:spermidine synthase